MVGDHHHAGSGDRRHRLPFRSAGDSRTKSIAHKGRTNEREVAAVAEKKITPREPDKAQGEKSEDKAATRVSRVRRIRRIRRSRK